MAELLHGVALEATTWAEWHHVASTRWLPPVYVDSMFSLFFCISVALVAIVTNIFKRQLLFCWIMFKFSWHVYKVSHTHTFNGTLLILFALDCLNWICMYVCLTGWARTGKVRSIWILLKQETVSGNGISWAICKFAPRSRQITTPAAHHSVFYWPDALPIAQPTASKYWRYNSI